MTEEPHFIVSHSAETPAKFIAHQIAAELIAGKNVIWLVPGGSAIEVAVKAAKIIRENKIRKNSLAIVLTDERYGPVNHSDSNYRQLIENGFELSEADFYPVLNGASVADDTNAYSMLLDKLMNKANYKIGLFGIGADYHTAGIKPGSPAVSSDCWASHFQGEDYQRITITPKCIAELDLAVVYALGEGKRDALNYLSTDKSLSGQPMQALKLSKKVVVFNDQIGGRYDDSN